MPHPPLARAVAPDPTTDTADGTNPAPSTKPWQWPRDHERVALPGLLGRIVHLLDRAMAPFWSNPVLFLLLVGIAVWASVWGFTSFYGQQYGRVPSYAWPFVPDSPLSTSAWILAALVIKAGWDRHGPASSGWALFTNWAAMMNAKVGVWTAFAILYYDDHFFAGGLANDLFQWMLIVSHLGMVVFATMLVRKQRRLPLLGYAVVLALGLLWDFMDYWFVDLFLPGSGIAIFPAGIPRDPDRLAVLGPVTVTFTVLATLYVAVATRLRGPPVER